jgi:hypothetical protein
MKSKIVRKVIRDSRRDRHEFGEGAGTAVVPARDTENLAVVTEVHLAAEAARTGSAINGGIKSDAIAWMKVVNVFAYGFHDSSGFVTHDDRRNAAPGRAVVAMNIAAADSTGGYANEELVGTDSGNRNIRDFKVVIRG